MEEHRRNRQNRYGRILCGLVFLALCGTIFCMGVNAREARQEARKAEAVKEVEEKRKRQKKKKRRKKKKQRSSGRKSFRCSRVLQWGQRKRVMKRSYI